MAYSIQHYAAALAQSISSGTIPEKVIEENFIALLKHNNDLSKLPAILEQVGKKLDHHSGSRQIVISSARPLLEDIQKKIATKFKSSDSLVWRIDPQLIAGIKITINEDYELDMSLRQKLTKLFR